MRLEDVVKLTIYLVGDIDIQRRREVIGTWLADHKPCMTLLFVSALATPQYRVEIDAWACARKLRSLIALAPPRRLAPNTRLQRTPKQGRCQNQRVHPGTAEKPAVSRPWPPQLVGRLCRLDGFPHLSTDAEAR